MSTSAQETIRDLAVFVRSKNAGPFTLTIDLFFDNAEDCQRIIDKNVLAPERIADLYRINAADIKVMHIMQANAMKVSFPRPIVAGDIGDCDVAGGQQFFPLLGIVVPD